MDKWKVTAELRKLLIDGARYATRAHYAYDVHMITEQGVTEKYIAKLTDRLTNARECIARALEIVQQLEVTDV